MSRLQLAVNQIIFARTYTIRLLDHTKPDDWFRQPAAGLTHIGWQVGHLVMAQYRLGMERIRGARPDDSELITEDFLKLFGAKSEPLADASLYPSTCDLRALFNQVHDKLLNELRDLPESELDQPVLKPHSLAKTKLDSLMWCAHHEGVHAGQIGLLRRQLGYSPVW
ncbi:MAG: DinB family protein [Gemmataceae bacterium]